MWSLQSKSKKDRDMLSELHRYFRHKHIKIATQQTAMSAQNWQDVDLKSSIDLSGKYHQLTIISLVLYVTFLIEHSVLVWQAILVWRTTDSKTLHLGIFECGKNNKIIMLSGNIIYSTCTRFQDKASFPLLLVTGGCIVQLTVIRIKNTGCVSPAWIPLYLHTIWNKFGVVWLVCWRGCTVKHGQEADSVMA